MVPRGKSHGPEERAALWRGWASHGALKARWDSDYWEGVSGRGNGVGRGVGIAGCAGGDRRGQSRRKSPQRPRTGSCFIPLPALPQNQVPKDMPVYHETKGVGAGIT